MQKLICIGDSHASFFSGINKMQPEFPELSDNKIAHVEGVRLGAVLAYSLHKNNTREKGREKLFQKLGNLNTTDHAVMFCFGEIDCRYHLLKQSEIKMQPVKYIIEDCVNKYFQVIQEVKHLGFDVLVWNVIPTTYDNFNPEYPNYGTHLQRNVCTKLFNKTLQEKCKGEEIIFIDISDKLIDKNNYTKGYFLFDGVHLGQLAMRFFIEKINDIWPRIKFEPPDKEKWYFNFMQEFLIYKSNRVKKIIKNTVKILFQKNKK
jgi:hypothetical protein